VTTEVAAVFRREHGRAVAVLVRQLGDISLAEEAVQDAFTAALERWPASVRKPPCSSGNARPVTMTYRTTGCD
jgi:RNA polymerase sigma-70 factor (ECF subfamily)